MSQHIDTVAKQSQTIRQELYNFSTTGNHIEIAFGGSYRGRITLIDSQSTSNMMLLVATNVNGTTISFTQFGSTEDCAFTISRNGNVLTLDRNSTRSSIVMMVETMSSGDTPVVTYSNVQS